MGRLRPYHGLRTRAGGDAAPRLAVSAVSIRNGVADDLPSPVGANDGSLLNARTPRPRAGRPVSRLRLPLRNVSTGNDGACEVVYGNVMVAVLEVLDRPVRDGGRSVGGPARVRLHLAEGRLRWTRGV